MSVKDLGQGWGDLNCLLTHWYCPKCEVNHPIQDWTVVEVWKNGNPISGRKCPKCDFQAFHHGDTMCMIPHPVSPKLVDGVVTIVKTNKVSSKKAPTKKKKGAK